MGTTMAAENVQTFTDGNFDDDVLKSGAPVRLGGVDIGNVGRVSHSDNPGDNRLYVWSLDDDRGNRFAVVNTLFARSAVEDGERRREGAVWLAWVTNDSIALATSASTITIIGLDPAAWRRRVDGLAIAPPSPLN